MSHLIIAIWKITLMIAYLMVRNIVNIRDLFGLMRARIQRSLPSIKLPRAAKAQALVLIAFLLLPLLGGAVGGAIDLGRYFALRREAQKTADVSALAAARAYCGKTGDPIKEGLRIAALNGFDKLNPRVSATITYAKVAGGVRFFADIGSWEPPAFTQLLGIQKIAASAQGDATCWDELYSLDKGTVVAFGNCEGVKISGSTVNVDGAIWSNTNISLNNSDGQYDSTYYVGDYSAAPGVVTSSVPTELESPIAMIFPSWSLYLPGGALYNEAVAAGAYFEYEGSQNIDGGTLPDGLHVFKGSGNVRIANLTGTRYVTIVILHNLDLHISANDAVLHPWGSSRILTISYAEYRNCGVKGVSFASNNVTWDGENWSWNNISFSDQGNSSVNGAIFAYSIDIQGSSTNFAGQNGDIKLPPSDELSK